MEGGFCEPIGQNPKLMIIKHNTIPRGCYREIRKYNYCAKAKGKDACFEQKLDIMEVCPEHILEGLQEKKKWLLRAELIDNETYKRAMQVSDYNKGRSVSDLQLKSWAYTKSLRRETVWADDRYNPTKHGGHPHRYDNVNFPDMEYKDMFGGNLGAGEKKEQEYYSMDLSGQSKATKEFKEMQKEKKKDETKEQ